MNMAKDFCKNLDSLLSFSVTIWLCGSAVELVPIVTALLLSTVPGPQKIDIHVYVYEPTKNFIIDFLFLNLSHIM